MEDLPPDLLAVEQLIDSLQHVPCDVMIVSWDVAIHLHYLLTDNRNPPPSRGAEVDAETHQRGFSVVQQTLVGRGSDDALCDFVYR